jgi:hypothetical protein
MKPPPVHRLDVGQVEKTEHVTVRLPAHLRESIRWYAEVLEEQAPGLRVTESAAHVVLLQRGLAREMERVLAEAVAQRPTKSHAEPVAPSKRKRKAARS